MIMRYINVLIIIIINNKITVAAVTPSTDKQSGLPWIWNFPSISISIFTDFPWISTDISIYTDAYLAYMWPLNFGRIEQYNRVHSPLKHDADIFLFKLF